ncbi:hypothetical protein DW182_02975 [Bacteroides sp. AM16-24]|nr:hypothetical protein DW182_02975 [Bacteroides sp. AM16-24]
MLIIMISETKVNLGAKSSIKQNYVKDIQGSIEKLRQMAELMLDGRVIMSVSAKKDIQKADTTLYAAYLIQVISILEYLFPSE